MPEKAAAGEPLDVTTLFQAMFRGLTTEFDEYVDCGFPIDPEDVQEQSYDAWNEEPVESDEDKGSLTDETREIPLNPLPNRQPPTNPRPPPPPLLPHPRVTVPELCYVVPRPTYLHPGQQQQLLAAYLGGGAAGEEGAAGQQGGSGGGAGPALGQAAAAAPRVLQGAGEVSLTDRVWRYYEVYQGRLQPGGARSYGLKELREQAGALGLGDNTLVVREGDGLVLPLHTEVTSGNDLHWAGGSLVPPFPGGAAAGPSRTSGGGSAAAAAPARDPQAAVQAWLDAAQHPGAHPTLHVQPARSSLGWLDARVAARAQALAGLRASNRPAAALAAEWAAAPAPPLRPSTVDPQRVLGSCEQLSSQLQQRQREMPLPALLAAAAVQPAGAATQATVNRVNQVAPHVPLSGGHQQQLLPPATGSTEDTGAQVAVGAVGAVEAAGGGDVRVWGPGPTPHLGAILQKELGADNNWISAGQVIQVVRSLMSECLDAWCAERAQPQLQLQGAGSEAAGPAQPQLQQAASDAAPAEASGGQQQEQLQLQRSGSQPGLQPGGSGSGGQQQQEFIRSQPSVAMEESPERPQQAAGLAPAAEQQGGGLADELQALQPELHPPEVLQPQAPAPPPEQQQQQIPPPPPPESQQPQEQAPAPPPPPPEPQQQQEQAADPVPELPPPQQPATTPTEAQQQLLEQAPPHPADSKQEQQPQAPAPPLEAQQEVVQQQPSPAPHEPQQQQQQPVPALPEPEQQQPAPTVLEPPPPPPPPSEPQQQQEPPPPPPPSEPQQPQQAPPPPPEAQLPPQQQQAAAPVPEPQPAIPIPDAGTHQQQQQYHPASEQLQSQQQQEQLLMQRLAAAAARSEPQPHPQLPLPQLPPLIQAALGNLDGHPGAAAMGIMPPGLVVPQGAGTAGLWHAPGIGSLQLTPCDHQPHAASATLAQATVTTTTAQSTHDAPPPPPPPPPGATLHPAPEADQHPVPPPTSSTAATGSSQPATDPQPAPGAAAATPNAPQGLSPPPAPLQPAETAAAAPPAPAPLASPGPMYLDEHVRDEQAEGMEEYENLLKPRSRGGARQQEGGAGGSRARGGRAARAPTGRAPSRTLSAPSLADMDHNMDHNSQLPPRKSSATLPSPRLSPGAVADPPGRSRSRALDNAAPDAKGPAAAAAPATADAAAAPSPFASSSHQLVGGRTRDDAPPSPSQAKRRRGGPRGTSSGRDSVGEGGAADEEEVEEDAAPAAARATGRGGGRGGRGRSGAPPVRRTASTARGAAGQRGAAAREGAALEPRRSARGERETSVGTSGLSGSLVSGGLMSGSLGGTMPSVDVSQAVAAATGLDEDLAPAVMEAKRKELSLANACKELQTKVIRQLLIKRPFKAEFDEPVFDKYELDEDNYRRLVGGEPMDLGTLQEKIKQGDFTPDKDGCEAFIAQLKRIGTNCKLFQEGSDEPNQEYIDLAVEFLAKVDSLTKNLWHDALDMSQRLQLDMGRKGSKLWNR